MAILHNDIYNKNKINKEISIIDKDIRNYIDANTSKEYHKAISNDERWEVFYHLSEMRSSLLNWYEFKEDVEVLEIGAEFGALTGVLCEKCLHVTSVESSLFRAESICKRHSDKQNLDVYAGEFEDIKFKKKFGYIVLVGVLEKQGQGSKLKDSYIKYLAKAKSLLKPNGKLLVATENRFGIKYFCGAVESQTGIPFEGINNYSNSKGKHSFSKQELKDIIEEAGFKHQKFYYPLPDYKLPQLIYSEDYLPEKNIGERLIPYYLNNKTLVASENDIYNDLVENNVFEFFSNSYLVECSLDENFCSTVYAAISIDRGKENGFITTIHNNDEVKKKPVYKEGNKSSLKLYENMKDIKEHGLCVVDNKFENDAITMPFIKDNTLSNYLKEIVRSDKDEFIRIIDRLYELILASSEHVDSQYNKLYNDETIDLNWGPILRKAYIELIPLNSFYINGEIVFFDQEFMKENYPAKYILFRALNYMYYFDPHINDIVPLNSLKERYEMFDTWQIFIDEEARFLSEIRNQELYKQFYKWARVDKNIIGKNLKALCGDFKDDEEYKITPKMKKVREIQLNLLEVFIEVCEKNQLKYYTIYGTLLGAIRHKGYIPWDDDIDIAMPRADYEKLKKIANNEFKGPYFLQTPENDSQCFYNGYSRLRNSNTTGISTMDIGRNCNNGIWIDILPLDNYCSDEKEQRKMINKINKVQKLLYAKVYGSDYESLFDIGKKEWTINSIITKFISHKYLCKLLDKALKVYANKDSEYIGIFTHYNKYQLLEKKDFENTVLVDFEHLKLRAPAGYERCLEMSIGRDYMEYPPKENRKPHHNGIFDTDYSYKKYKQLFFDLFDECENKKIILFGAGLMFEDYMKKYKKKYTPDFIVDNDKAKWGHEKQGVLIKSPKSILNILEEDRRVIICSVHYRQIEKQLKDMGVTDYRIYIQDKNWIASNVNET